MGLSEDVKSGVDEILSPEWDRRKGRVVPETEDIALKNGAVDIEATYLYADMADSTGLAQGYKDWAVGKVIRSFLNASTRIIRHRGGAIRSFDGDRVMGIFIGENKNTDAARAALNITWAVDQIINPALKSKWDNFKWTMRHGVGVDTGSAMLVRGGVHGENDIVSIGGAPNIAAKLSDIRSSRFVNISEAVYNQLKRELKYTTTGVSMWTKEGMEKFGGTWVTYYGSSYYWKP